MYRSDIAENFRIKHRKNNYSPPAPIHLPKRSTSFARHAINRNTMIPGATIFKKLTNQPKSPYGPAEDNCVKIL